MSQEQAARRGRTARRANAVTRPGGNAAAAGAEDAYQCGEKRARVEREEGDPTDGVGQASPSQAARRGRAARQASAAAHAGEEAETAAGEELAPVRRGRRTGGASGQPSVAARRGRASRPRRTGGATAASTDNGTRAEAADAGRAVAEAERRRCRHLLHKHSLLHAQHEVLQMFE